MKIHPEDPRGLPSDDKRDPQGGIILFHPNHKMDNPNPNHCPSLNSAIVLLNKGTQIFLNLLRTMATL